MGRIYGKAKLVVHSNLIQQRLSAGNRKRRRENLLCCLKRSGYEWVLGTHMDSQPKFKLTRPVLPGYGVDSTTNLTRQHPGMLSGQFGTLPALQSIGCTTREVP